MEKMESLYMMHAVFWQKVLLCIKQRKKEARPLRKTDITRYSDDAGARNHKKVVKSDVCGTLKASGRIIGKLFLSLFWVCLVVGTIVGITLLSFILSMKDEAINYDLRRLKLNYTTFIYVNGEGDDPNNPVELQSLYSGENRVWVDFKDIPQNMKDAIVAIEDKRFYEHEGVDWIRTFGAVTSLITGQDSYGGSTITQQLIKNITGDNEVSLTRKVKEIFRALNLEKEYSKDEILEVYLNVVNFGSGCNGVQAAANLYFGKDIQDCNLAECAAIAGITQNPYKFTPLLHPDQNQERQQIVLTAMYDQGFITKEEYEEAYEQSKHMKFVGKKVEDAVEDIPVWNWYTEMLFEDVKEDLMELYGYSEEMAVDMIYHDGLKIYSAQNTEMQSFAEAYFKDTENFPLDSGAQAAFMAMDYDGRILASVGAVGEKEGNRVGNYVTDAVRQPGSSIKPLVAYGPAIDLKVLNYSSIVKDEPIDNYFDDGRPGPNNATGYFLGDITLQEALARSVNPPAVRTLMSISIDTGADYLHEKFGFREISKEERVKSLAIGGIGFTVREMTGGFQTFGNGGVYNEPYTYYYVEDHDGNIILDNRDNIGTQAISEETATIMHKLLNTVVYDPVGTGRLAAINGWEVFAKTGTTNEEKDSWFVGGTSYAVAGVWTGYPMYDHTVQNTGAARIIWKTIMEEYLKDKEPKEFTFSPNVISATYCKETGCLAVPGVCQKTATGWYTTDNMPKYCTGNHASSSSSEASSSESSSSSSSSSSSVPSSSVAPPSSEPESSSGESGGTSHEPESSTPSQEPSSSEPEPSSEESDESQESSSEEELQT